MFKEDFNAASGAAAAKSSFLKKNPVGYFVLSVLAGMYIGFGILLSFTTGGLLAGEAAAKLAMGATFGVALSFFVVGEGGGGAGGGRRGGVERGGRGARTGGEGRGGGRRGQSAR